MVTQAMAAFVSTTANCARCHAHKFDPITQEDYYSLQAVFAGVGRGNVAYDIDLALTRKRQDLTARLKSLDQKESREASIQASLSDPTFARNFEEWIRHQAEKPNIWRPVDIQALLADLAAAVTGIPVHSR